MTGTETGDTEGFRDLSLQGKIPAQPNRIPGINFPRPQETDVSRGQFGRLSRSKPQVCVHPPLIPGKMVPYIFKKARGFFIRHADDGYTGCFGNTRGIENIEPRDHAAGEKDNIEIGPIQIPDHLKHGFGGIRSTDRYLAERETVYPEIFAHHNPGKIRTGPACITFRNTQCPQPFLGDVHRSTYDNRLKILYQ